MAKQGTKSYRETELKVLNNIKRAIDCEEANNQVYEKNLRFYYECGMSEDDKRELEKSEKTQLSFNMLPPIVNQNAKQISDAAPTTKVKAIDEDSPQMVMAADIINQKLTDLFEKNKYNTEITKASVQAMVAAKAVFRLKTDYISSRSFDQKPIIEYLSDPTKVYFDPKSKNPSRSDARYVVHKIELTEDELKEEFPKADVREIIVNSPQLKSRSGEKNNYTYTICDYYYIDGKKENLYVFRRPDGDIILGDSDIKRKNVKLSKNKNEATLSDETGGEITFEIVEQREITKKKVKLQRILGKQVLIEQDLNFDVIPYFQLTAKQWQDDNKMHIAPFIDDAIDAQRAKNMMGNEFLSESLNLYKQMYAISDEQATPQTWETLRDPNTKNILRYKAVIEGPNGEQMIAPPPTVTPMTHVPPEYIQMFTQMDSTIQGILGAYQLSLNEKELSGKALYNMAQYISGILTPFVNNLLEMLEAMTLAALSCFRYIYADENYDFNYEIDEFEIGIEAGINNKLQQEANLEKIIDLAKVNPQSMFAQFLSSPEGTVLLLKNMDLNDKEKVIQEFEQFVKQSHQQPPQSNPANTVAQANLIRAQTEARAKPAELALKNKQIEADIATENNKVLADLHKTKSSERNNAINSLVQAEKIQAENLKTLRGQ